MISNKLLTACIGSFALLAATGLCAQEQPNINFGLWETTATTTMQTPQFSMPANTVTSSDCVTQEDYDEGMAFVQDQENCRITEEDLRSDGADYTMACDMPEMGEMLMKMSMTFDSDSMNGTMTGTMDTPMGEMNMKVDMAGTRIGDCE